MNGRTEERLSGSHHAEQNQEPEKGIVVDMLVRGMKVAPVWLIFSWLVWGLDGVASSAYGLGLIFANFAAAAAFLTWAGRISVTWARNTTRVRTSTSWQKREWFL